MPSAAASNGRHRPVGDSIPVWLVQTCICGVHITATPPASAVSQSPERRLSQARCTAVNDDEHAVSIAIVGPVRSSRYAIRAGRIELAPPRNASLLSLRPCRSSSRG